MATIWIAEDDPVLREVAKVTVESRGHRAEAMTTANLAQAAADHDRPDLLLADPVDIPQWTGRRLVLALKKPFAPLELLKQIDARLAEDDRG
ncbi:MAG: hypothetical protein AAFY88_26355 [Acidobacteriota bacterium]